MLLLRLAKSDAISCIDSGALSFDWGGPSASGPSHDYHMSSKHCSWATVRITRWMNTDWIHMVPCLVSSNEAFGILHVSEFE
jgi:hypothetical protein